MVKKYLFLSFVFSLLFLVLSFQSVFAQVNTSKINTTLPGMAGGDNPCQFVFSFYTFALMIGGILAFGAIVYGGVKYTIAAGNPSGQSEGKEWVKGALLGLLLLVGAYLILNVINPDLTKCTLPQLGGITNATPGSGQVNTGGAGGQCLGQFQCNITCSGQVMSYCTSDCASCGSGVGCTKNSCGSAGFLNYACPANSAYGSYQVYACDTQNSPTCANAVGCLSGAACTQIPNSQCGAGVAYACQAPNGVYACDTQNSPTCANAVGCASGAACTPIPNNQCGTNSSPFPNCQPTSAGVGTCANYGCNQSPQLVAFLKSSCLPAGFGNSITATTDGPHTCDPNQGFVSCHFGGTKCTDGGHAVDFGWNSGLKNSYPTLGAALQALQNANCPDVSAARCELQGGASDPSCTGNNHIHVSLGSCGCL